jgi:hypothetical protein
MFELYSLLSQGVFVAGLRSANSSSRALARCVPYHAALASDTNSEELPEEKKRWLFTFLSHGG